MPHQPPAGSPLTPAGPGGPARSTLSDRGGRGLLVVVGFAAGGVVAFIWWKILADAQQDAMRTILSSTVTCVTDRPTPTIVGLLAIGLSCCAVGAVVSYVVRRRPRDLRRRPWAGVAATASVILLVVQALTFLVHYAPDSSQQSGGEFSATYCSAG